MKFSVALMTVLAGLAIASPVAEPIAEAEAAAEGVEGVVEGRDILDPNCIRCVKRGCGKDAVKCIRARHPGAIAACLAFFCVDDYARCCL